MDLIGVQVGRSELAQAMGVDLCTIVEAPQAGVVGRGRQLRLEHRNGFAPGRVDAVADDSGSLVDHGSAGGLLHRVHRAKALGQGADQWIVDSAAVDEIAHLRDGCLQDEARRKDAARGLPARFLHGLAHARLEQAQARQIVVGILRVAQRVHHGQQAWQVDVDTTELLQRIDRMRMALAVHKGLQLPLHQLCRYALGIAHGGRIEVAQAGQSLAGQRHRFAAVARGLRGELAVHARLQLVREEATAG